MKFYLMTLLVLSSFITYQAQGIRTGKFDLSASSHQDIIKISLVIKGSVPDDQLLAKSAKLPSGINRKLMTKTTSASTVTINSDATDIAEMDYTPARKKSPIHN